MNRSDLKELIKEAVIEIIPDLALLIAEHQKKSGVMIETQTKSMPPASRMTELIAKTIGGDAGYDDLGGIASPKAPPVRRASTGSRPPNVRGELENGEKYASGEGVLEWYGETSATDSPASEFKHSEDDMNNFIANIGKK